MLATPTLLELSAVSLSLCFFIKTKLQKVSQGLSEIYQSHVAGYLNDINLHTFEVTCCHDTNCVSSEHKPQIDLLYTHLTDCLTNATSLCFGFGYFCSNSSVKKSMPKWSDFVSDARAAASDAHNIWQQCNKPKMVRYLSLCSVLVHSINMQYAFVVRMKNVSKLILWQIV